MLLGERPLVAETPEHLLDDETTPTAKFFVRNNGQIPEEAKEPDKWKITIDGEVNNKLELTLGELKAKFKPVTQRMVLECGGNGRSFFTPQARGNQWTNGGAGCAEWTGVRLSDVLKAAGVKSSAMFTGHYGSDRSLADASKDALSRGVPIKKAMDANNLIVFAMNGQPLPNIHGGPVRLVIPGWPGSVSAKWFNRLWVRDKYHDGPGMGATSYRVAIKPMVPGGKPDDGNFRDLESMPVRSIITSPANGTKLAAGTKEVKLRGAAWAGDNTVRQVDVSTDFGATWTRRQARRPKNKYDWQRWTATREAAVGRLFRDLDARHQLQGRDAAAHRRRLESAGLRRQSDAPGRGAGRLMRAILRDGDGQPRAGRRIVGSGGACAGAAVHAARRELPRTIPPAPAATIRSTPAPPATASSWSPSRA